MTTNQAAKLFVFVFIFAAIGSIVESSPQLTPFLRPEVIKRLGLNDTQVAKIEGIVAEYGPRIAEAEKVASPTAAQLDAREQAVKNAIAAGKRGIAARTMITTASCDTAEQKVAGETVIRLRNGLDQAIFEVLTKEQQGELEDHGLITVDEHNGFIIVRLKPSVHFSFRDSETLADFAIRNNLQSLARFLKDHRMEKSYRVMQGISGTSFPNPSIVSTDLFQRLQSYWRIDVRHDAEKANAIVDQLDALPEVDLAYRELNTSDPSFTSTNNPFTSHQGYLDAAPKGIDARFAWSQRNGRGAGIGLADVEQSWNPRHEDLAGQCPLLVWGHINPGDHGTAVLGTAVAEDNLLGIVGSAPSIDYVFLSSKVPTPGSRAYLVADAMLHVLLLMNPGDVLLLEVETVPDRHPIEVQDLEFDAIQAAVFCGITVVEAGGNGGWDLDALEVNGKKILNRSDPDFRDSGAILVGAAAPFDHHNRIGWSNHGSRIDCFAWGHRVVTSGTIAGSPDLSNGGGDPNKKYTTNFNGTSASAPIIAGGAILLQGMAKANSGILLTPLQIRAFLANRTTGTPQGPINPENIGVMPNLKAIIESNSVFTGTISPCQPVRVWNHTTKRGCCTCTPCNVFRP